MGWAAAAGIEAAASDRDMPNARKIEIRPLHLRYESSERASQQASKQASKQASGQWREYVDSSPKGNGFAGFPRDGIFGGRGRVATHAARQAYRSWRACEPSMPAAEHAGHARQKK